MNSKNHQTGNFPSKNLITFQLNTRDFRSAKKKEKKTKSKLFHKLNKTNKLPKHRHWTVAVIVVVVIIPSPPGSSIPTSTLSLARKNFVRSLPSNVLPRPTSFHVVNSTTHTVHELFLASSGGSGKSRRIENLFKVSKKLPEKTAKKKK